MGCHATPVCVAYRLYLQQQPQPPPPPPLFHFALPHTVIAGRALLVVSLRSPERRLARQHVAMEGNGGAGGGSGSAAPPWDLAMHWAPHAGSSYPQQPLALRPGGGVPSQLQLQQQELTCLKLGKRAACCWAGAAAGNQVAQQAGAGLPQQVHGNGGGAAVGGGSGTTPAAEGKRKEKAAATAPAAAVPRCQVEGCHVALADAKDYHRRHKVCEAHSKAPCVVVLGAEQRFCQQCSRFHAISEFDDAKRSCRRRLAGHNERRRKSNASEAMARGVAHPHGVAAFGHGFLPSRGLPAGSPAGALSLLSSARGVASAAPWLVTTTPDISARSSAALDDLIAENRAALLAWQYFSDHRSEPSRHFASSTTPAGGALQLPADQTAASWHPHPHSGVGSGRYHVGPPPPSAWHTTLDLMQTTSTTAPAATGGAPPFRPVPERAGTRSRSKAKDGDASGCSLDAWVPAGGARVL